MESIAVVAMDIHKQCSKAVWMDGDENILGEAGVSHECRDEMREFLRPFDSETDVVMEATFNRPWIAEGDVLVGGNDVVVQDGLVAAFADDEFGHGAVPRWFVVRYG